MQLIRVTCPCKTCKSNGVSAADVPELLASAPWAQTAKARHGFVWNAHDPSPVGRKVRESTGLVPVAA